MLSTLCGNVDKHSPFDKYIYYQFCHCPSVCQPQHFIKLCIYRLRTSAKLHSNPTPKLSGAFYFIQMGFSKTVAQIIDHLNDSFSRGCISPQIFRRMSAKRTFTNITNIWCLMFCWRREPSYMLAWFGLSLTVLVQLPEIFWYFSIIGNYSHNYFISSLDNANIIAITAIIISYQVEIMPIL